MFSLSPTQEKIVRYLGLKEQGTSINLQLRNQKGFHNPDFLQSVVEHFGIDEFATNFADTIFDPKGLHHEDFYDKLASEQRREMEKKDKERRDKGSIEFMSAGNVAASRGIAAQQVLVPIKPLPLDFW